MGKSIITEDLEHCLLCGSTNNIEMHHVFFGTADRKLSDKYGLVVPLCAFHHRGNFGVHGDRTLDLMLKEMCQTIFETKVGSREDFMKLFGRNYL